MVELAFWFLYNVSSKNTIDKIKSAVWDFLGLCVIQGGVGFHQSDSRHTGLSVTHMTDRNKSIPSHLQNPRLKHTSISQKPDGADDSSPRDKTISPVLDCQ